MLFMYVGAESFTFLKTFIGCQGKFDKWDIMWFCGIVILSNHNNSILKQSVLISIKSIKYSVNVQYKIQPSSRALMLNQQ